MTSTGPHPRILMVICDPVAPSGLIGETILDKGGFYDTILPGEGFASWQPLAYPGLPGSPEGYDGLVILGGPMSANDAAEHPWLGTLEALATAFAAFALAPRSLLGVEHLEGVGAEAHRWHPASRSDSLRPSRC